MKLRELIEIIKKYHDSVYYEATDFDTEEPEEVDFVNEDCGRKVVGS
jgi:hypothetical protein